MNKVLGASLASVMLFASAASAAPTSIELPGEKVFPESVTATADGTLYVGSFAEGGIMKVAPGADHGEPWIKPGAYDTRSILGVLADEKAGLLWVCSNDLSGLGVAGPSQVKGSFLKGFDLKTGDGKVSVKLPGDRTLCNDIALGPDGAAYVTDSLQPTVLRLKRGAKPAEDKLEVYVESPLFNPPPPGKGAGLDGIAFGADGNLYVNKFTEATLFRVDVKDGKPSKATQLKPTAPLTLADGMRPVDGGHAFLMIEGTGRLDRVTVSGDQAKIETLKDGLNGPTAVTPVGNTAWVAEGQLPSLLDKSKGPPKLPFSLKAVPIQTP